MAGPTPDARPTPATRPAPTARLNGEPVDAGRLLSLALTGYGLVTSMRVEAGRVRGLGLHLDRLASDCRTLFGAELDRERVRDLARRATATLPPGGTGVVRITVFDPGLDLAHPAASCADGEPQVLVSTRPAPAVPSSPIRVQTRRFVRDLPGVKSVGLFGQLVHRREAQLAGYDDALFVSESVDGGAHVSEGGTWNVGFVDADGTVVWPDADVLECVTMRLLQRAHPHVVRPVPQAEVTGLRAAFATNAAVGVRAIRAIDDTTLSVDDPVIDGLRQAYLDLPADPL